MEWYYANNGQQAGPVSQDELADLLRNGVIKSTDLVWNESMSEWAAIGTVPDFAAARPQVAPTYTETPPSLTPPPYSSSVPAAPSYSDPSGNPAPPNYLWQSIVVMLVCCLPLGIPALVFSTKVGPAHASGDHAAALDASKKAKLWCIIALVSGLVGIVLYVIFIVFAGVMGASAEAYQ